VSASDALGNNPLHWSVITRQLDLIERFAELGTPIDARRADDMNARLVLAKPCDAPGAVGLPKPIAIFFFEFAEQQADGFVAFGQTDFVGADHHQRFSALETADHQQDDEQHRRRGQQRAADQYQHDGNRGAKDAEEAQRRQR